MVILTVLPAPLRGQDHDRWTGRDKALHFSISTGIGAAGYGAGALVFETRPPRLLTGIGLAMAAGAGKELRDRRHGDASWRDLTWDAIGAVTGATIAWVIDRARQSSPTASRARPAKIPSTPVAPIGLDLLK